MWPMPCSRQMRALCRPARRRARGRRSAGRTGAHARLRFESPGAERPDQPERDGRLLLGLVEVTADQALAPSDELARHDLGARLRGTHRQRDCFAADRDRDGDVGEVDRRPADHRQVRDLELAEPVRAGERDALAELLVGRAHPPLQVVAVAEAAEGGCFGLQGSGIAGVAQGQLVGAHAVGVAAEREEQVAAQVMQARKLERRAPRPSPAARPRRAPRGPRRCDRSGACRPPSRSALRRARRRSTPPRSRTAPPRSRRSIGRARPADARAPSAARSASAARPRGSGRARPARARRHTGIARPAPRWRRDRRPPRAHRRRDRSALRRARGRASRTTRRRAHAGRVAACAAARRRRRRGSARGRT